MSTSRCAYCGDWAENPVFLSWAISDGPEETRGEVRAGRLPLCCACGNSWCPQPAPSAGNRPEALIRK